MLNTEIIWKSQRAISQLFFLFVNKFGLHATTGQRLGFKRLDSKLSDFKTTVFDQYRTRMSKIELVQGLESKQKTKQETNQKLEQVQNFNFAVIKPVETTRGPKSIFISLFRDTGFIGRSHSCSAKNLFDLSHYKSSTESLLGEGASSEVLFAKQACSFSINVDLSTHKKPPKVFTNNRNRQRGYIALPFPIFFYLHLFALKNNAIG